MDTLVEALVPGMPAAARAKVTGQAQGIPLFAVETVRSLIDRDIVQPVEGVYRLIGDVGELAVPDSLHALLAARLDALDPGVRRLVADAAVLGTTFPAEALIAVSGQDEAVVRAALAELVRREVLTVSADPLSPERGSYGFAQQMLRQVAYDTLSRRDRKARHLKVAAHLRAAFPGDGEEVADVIARHYLDALEAVPDDPDAGQIRGQAIAALIRAAERAERHRRPRPRRRQLRHRRPAHPGRHRRRAADSRRRVVGTRRRAPPPPTPTRPRRSSRPARPGICTGRAATPARPPAPRPSPGRRCAGGAGTPRRASSSPPPWRCCGKTPTPTPSGPWANWRRWRCSPASPDADALSAEALALGQDLAVDDATLADLFTTRGICHGYAGRRPQAAAYFREAARLAEPGRRHRPAGPRAAQPVRHRDRHRPRRRRRGRPRRRRPPAPGRRPRPPRGRGREPGPGAADDRRLGRRRGRAGPGRRRRRPRPTSNTSPATGPGWRRCAATPPPPRRSWPGWATCGPAKTPRTRRPSRSRRRSPPPPAASPPPRCATPAPSSATPAPSGSATSTCGGRGRWPPAPPTTSPTPPPPPSCWPCSTATSPGSWPPCSAPNATWPAPA